MKNRFFVKMITMLVLVALLTAFAIPAMAAGKGPVWSFTPPSTPNMTVGTQLGYATLNGGAAYVTVDGVTTAVPGYFAWVRPNDRLAQPGRVAYQCYFVPNDPAYGTQVLWVYVSVYRINLTIAEKPEASDIAVGQSLIDSLLSGGKAWNHAQQGVEIPGTFCWVDAEQSFDAPGDYECAVKFVPSDAVMYNDTTVTYERNPDRSFKDAFVTVHVTGAADTADEAEAEPAPEMESAEEAAAAEAEAVKEILTEAEEAAEEPAAEAEAEVEETAAEAEAEVEETTAETEIEAEEAEKTEEPQGSWFSRLWKKLFG